MDNTRYEVYHEKTRCKRCGFMTCSNQRRDAHRCELMSLPPVPFVVSADAEPPETLHTTYYTRLERGGSVPGLGTYPSAGWFVHGFWGDVKDFIPDGTHTEMSACEADVRQQLKETRGHS